jgi:Acetoacetate decarboxylase (ADC)
MDPPWVLRGSSVTAWFPTSAGMVKRMLSPDLEPVEEHGGVPTRLRFYWVDYGRVDGNPADRDGSAGNWSRAGSFHEAVVAFAVSVGGSRGEVSCFMWTDDESYLLWGREAFGWPLLRADVRTGGTIWDGSQSRKAFDASARADGIELGLSGKIIGADERAGLSPATWLTPRRTITWGADGKFGQMRELLLVHPQVIRAGQHVACQGDVEFRAPDGHPLASIRPLAEPILDAALNFEIIVGGQVRSLQQPRGAADAAP